MKTFTGIIPAAGLASRLSPLPFSKELLPGGITTGHEDRERIKVISAYLVESMKSAGIRNIHIVLRSGKWDIPGYYRSGKDHGVNVCYHITEYLDGPPFTIDSAYPFITNENVILGFPDIIFTPGNALNRLCMAYDEDQADVVLALFPQKQFMKWDMVSIDENRTVRDIIIKDKTARNFKYAWFAAAWNSRFTGFLHEYLESVEQKPDGNRNEHLKEIQIGTLFLNAGKAGLSIKGIIMDDVLCLDTGTFDGYRQMPSFLTKDMKSEK